MRKFVDDAALKGTKITGDGYLIADAYAVRTGIQQYAGYEVGRPDLSVVNVYRPEGEVFSVDSLRSFSHVPVTDNHPTEPVTADNWKDYAVGEVSTDVLRDGERLRIPLVLKDKAIIALVQSGKRELSAGYSCDLSFEDGVAPDGTKYQAVQRNIRANHLAVVDRGRAGSDFRIGDADHWGATPIQDKGIPMNLRKILVDGLPFEVNDAAADIINKLLADKAKLTTDNLELTASVNKVTADKDGEIGALKVELKKAQDAMLTGDKLDALIAARSALVDTARGIVADLNPAGMTDADIRKAVVTKALGDEMTKDASEAEIAGMFKAVTKDAKGADPVRKALGDRTVQTQVSDHGQSEYEKRLVDAWKGDSKAA